MDKKINLFFDSSGKYLVLILFTKSKIISSKAILNPQKHVEIFDIEIKKFLAQNKIHFHSLLGFYTTIQHGSFIGLKIGLIIGELLLFRFPHLTMYVTETAKLLRSTFFIHQQYLLITCGGKYQGYKICKSTQKLVVFTILPDNLSSISNFSLDQQNLIGLNLLSNLSYFRKWTPKTP